MYYQKIFDWISNTYNKCKSNLCEKYLKVNNFLFDGYKQFQDRANKKYESGKKFVEDTRKNLENRCYKLKNDFIQFCINLQQKFDPDYKMALIAKEWIISKRDLIISVISCTKTWFTTQKDKLVKWYIEK